MRFRISKILLIFSFLISLSVHAQTPAPLGTSGGINVFAKAGLRAIGK